MKNITSESIVKAFVENWVSRFGVPLRLTSDRGAQFTSVLFYELSILLRSQYIQTTSYKTIKLTNGMIERVHKCLKEALRCHGDEWVKHLPIVLLDLRCAPRDKEGVSCAELALCMSLRLAGEFYESSTEINDSYFYT